MALHAAAGASGDLMETRAGLIGEQQQFALGVLEFGEAALEGGALTLERVGLGEGLGGERLVGLVKPVGEERDREMREREMTGREEREVLNQKWLVSDGKSDSRDYSRKKTRKTVQITIWARRK